METESSFLWFGGHLCMDIINTEIMNHGRRVDLIPDTSTLLAWLEEAHLLDVLERQSLVTHWVQHPNEGEDTLQIFKELRTVVRGMADEIISSAKVSPETLQAINHHLERRLGHYELSSTSEGNFTERFVEQKVGMDWLPGRIAGTISDFLSHADLSLVRHCENPHCILYFYDTTKNHKRRWCSMSGCGNRAKAAAHYQRKKENLGKQTNSA